MWCKRQHHTIIEAYVGRQVHGVREIGHSAVATKHLLHAPQSVQQPLLVGEVVLACLSQCITQQLRVRRCGGQLLQFAQAFHDVLLALRLQLSERHAIRGNIVTEQAGDGRDLARSTSGGETGRGCMGQ